MCRSQVCVCVIYCFLLCCAMADLFFVVSSCSMKGGDSHKKIDLSANPILRHYYHNKVMCLCGRACMRACVYA